MRLDLLRADDRGTGRALMAALPPAWSGCQWVFQIWVIFQPLALGLGEDAVGFGRVDAGGLAAVRVVQQEAVIVLEARKHVDDGTGQRDLPFETAFRLYRSRLRLSATAWQAEGLRGADALRHRQASDLLRLARWAAWRRTWWRGESARCGPRWTAWTCWASAMPTPCWSATAPGPGGWFRHRLTPRAPSAGRPMQRAWRRWSRKTGCPFPDALFDRLIVFHGLEEAESPQRLLREFWRVAAPEARILIIVAHRRGLWARAESTPFGHGRPYTRSQLYRLLEEAMFLPTASARALYAPPIGWGLITSAGRGLGADRALCLDRVRRRADDRGDQAALYRARQPRAGQKGRKSPCKTAEVCADRLTEVAFRC